MPLYIEKVEIWSGDTDASLTDSQTMKDIATQGPVRVLEQEEWSTRNAIRVFLS